MANLPLTEIVIPDSEDVLELAPDLSDEVTALQGAVNTLNTDVSNIPNGTYPNLTAGSILTDKYDIDTLPYLYRALPYRSKRLEEELVGGSVVWNQLIAHSEFSQGITGWGTYNATIASESNAMKITSTGAWGNARTNADNPNYVAGHKYLILIVAKGDSGGEYIGVNNNNGVNEKLGDLTTSKAMYSWIFTATNTGNYSFSIMTNTSGNIFYVYEVTLIDITQFFGNATIADAIYAMEQAQAGSGVSFMRKYFHKLFSAEYDTGTLKSVNPTAHVTRGVNAWDEEWELGTIDATGTPTASSATIRSKNYIQIIPNTTYYCKGEKTFFLHFYDADKNWISSTSKHNETFTTPVNAYYMKFRLSSGTSYNNDMCINISDPTINGKYFPYEEHTCDLGNVPLYGLFQLVDNTLKAYGDVRHAVGGTDRKFALLDLGTLNWTLDIDNVFISNDIDDILVGARNANDTSCLCQKYIYLGINYQSTLTDKTFIKSVNSKTIRIRDTSYTDAVTFKTAMSGLYLVYEKTTPTTEDTPSFEKIQSCFPYGTEEYITTNGVPVGHETKYFTDVIGNIENIPAPPTTNGTYTLKVTVSASGNTYAWV